MLIRQSITSICVASAVSAAWAADPMVEQIRPYVYPQSTAESPATMAYAPDGLSYYQLSDDGSKINRYDTFSGELIETALDVTHTRTSSITVVEDFTLSPDGSKMLVYAESTPIYRRSFKAPYYVFEIKRNILKPLSATHQFQQIPQFSPDGRMVAFVADGNIIIKKLDYDNEIAVTSDGAINKIRNGLPDWTYEEEFCATTAMTWSPDNAQLCFLKFDESMVPTYSMTQYQGMCDPKPQYALYPGQFSYKYPVAGERNSKVSLHVYDIENRTVKDIKLGGDTPEYIPRITYAYSPERLMVVTLNRAQNQMDVYSVNPKSTVAKNILTERSSTWIEPQAYQDIFWQPDGWVMQSIRTGYNHLYKYSYAGALQRQITSGDWNVTDYYGMDAAGNHYFQSTSSGPLDRTVEMIDAKGARRPLSKTAGYASATFSPAMNCYLLCYSDPTTPPVYTLYNIKHKQMRVVEDNQQLAMKVPAMATKEFFTMESDGVKLNGYMIKPANFVAGKRYPVIMWQYSGPGSQEVLHRWQFTWEQLAAQMGFGVVCVDGRGTGGRDAQFSHMVYRRLGHYETIDQVNAARYVASLPWVDPKAIGIAGWSYGGYEALMAASEKSAPYAAAVAIAPVTDWRFYDSVYAERYMLTPKENEEGYAISAPISRVNQLGCPLLLMHGTSDDNVHLANTMEYAAQLVADGNFCDMMLFPGMNHSINGCDSRAVVFAKMLNFFNTHLNHR